MVCQQVVYKQSTLYERSTVLHEQTDSQAATKHLTLRQTAKNILGYNFDAWSSEETRAHTGSELCRIKTEQFELPVISCLELHNNTAEQQTHTRYQNITLQRYLSGFFSPISIPRTTFEFLGH